MASVTGKTSIKIDDLINNTIVSGRIDPSSGNLILTSRGGADINAGAVVKPFGAPWSSTTSYDNGDVVGYAGSLWKAVGGNTNKPPALFTSLWNRLTGESLNSWVERDSYFSGDSLAESWNLFWKTGTVTASLDTIAGEFETGIQSLKLDMLANSFQRFYQKEENIVQGGEKIQVQIRARLLSTASGVTIDAEMLQNSASGKPEPSETGVGNSPSAEGAKTLTTTWTTYTFTMIATNAKPRAAIDVLIQTGSSAAVVLIDRVKTSKLSSLTDLTVAGNSLWLPKSQEYDSGWIVIGDIDAPAYAAGNPYGAAFQVPRFRRIGDVVFMEGLVASPPAAGNTIFTLPVGFRPDGDIIPVGIGNAATENHAIKVYADGRVATGTGVTGWTSLSCQFPVAGAASPWHIVGAVGEPAFGAGWTNYAGAWQTARFMRIGDYVYMSGLVTRTSGTNNTIFTLPSGYVNTNGTSHTPAAGSSALLGSDGGINISSDVVCRGTGTFGWISLAGIRIYVGPNDKKWRKFRGGADGYYLINGAYGGAWPIPAIRRDGNVVFLEGLANFTASGSALKLPFGFSSDGDTLIPVLNATNKRVDVLGPAVDNAASRTNAVVTASSGTMGFTNSWVVAEEFERNDPWNR